ncbi:nitrilase-related carbon-nitrogen hydrolase [Thermocrinis minervae]|uniref:Predicted amidohydrolase n=1 Tax=Thermocrinis minervae TaxID=381751 RepID=A0A1M6S2P4_9AQUI|nr:nitrilase-related carbon-nitrogen hydrolase [Thermocrinis minervae]SHK38747.1 Predicted amidohydrolase [Thermocrinis minervae]
MRVYSLQFKVAFGKVEENLKIAEGFLNQVEEGSLVVLPEMWQCGFDYENMYEHAKATDQIIEKLVEYSGKRKLTIVGTYPVLKDGRLYNSAVIISEGKLLGQRSKIKLFPLYEENNHFSPGDENPVFYTPHGPIGILICFELRFPELALDLRRKGAKILVVPSMWGLRRKEHLRVLTLARALDTQSFLILANAYGKIGEEEYAGCSAIVDPWGRLLAYSDWGDTLLSSFVDLKLVDEVRKGLPLS